MSDRDPAFLFYAKDWRDVRVRRMSLEAQGAYAAIMADMWADSEDQCSILDDDACLARALGCDGIVWQRLRMEIQHPSDPLLIQKDGRLISKRLMKEAAKRKEFKEKQRDNASRGWQKRRMPRHEIGNVLAYAKTCLLSSSSSSSEDSSESSDSLLSFDSLLTSGETFENFIRARWNAIGGVKPCKAITGPIRKSLAARVKQYPMLGFWDSLFARIARAPFLTGKGEKGWAAPLDWVLKPTNLAKILAGNYDDDRAAKEPAGGATCQGRVKTPSDRFGKPCGKPVKGDQGGDLVFPYCEACLPAYRGAYEQTQKARTVKPIGEEAAT